MFVFVFVITEYRFFFLPVGNPKIIKIQTYGTVILPFVLYGYVTWALTMWEERKLKVFENRVLRKMLRTQREKVAGKWRRLHNEELYNMDYSPILIRVIQIKKNEISHV